MRLQSRTAAVTGLSTTALAAILTGVGVVLLGLLIGLVVLLVRAIRNHKRLLADLEERGIIIAKNQAEQDSNLDSIAKPRAVLRRNTLLPYNKQSGWGALPSVETINPPEPTSVPPHYVPPKPVGYSSRHSRLSWPFSGRRASGKAVQLRKIRVPILSTVIESPKPSPLVPVLNGSQLGGEQQSPKQTPSRPSSDQSLLQHHPAFRNTDQTEECDRTDSIRPELLRRSLTSKPVTKMDINVRPNRSKSVAEIPTSSRNGDIPRRPRPRPHSRSASTCSQASGKAPDVPMPPLPLGVARIKSETRRQSLLSRSPSRISVSSFESAGSSILATQSSPILPWSNNVRVHHVTTRDWGHPMVVGPRPRPIRDTLTLHGKTQRSPSPTKGSPSRSGMSNSSMMRQQQIDNRSSTLTASSSFQSIKVNMAESVTMSRFNSPGCSPLTVRSSMTPRRRSGSSHVTAYGSPEERRPSVLRDVSGNIGSLKRQISQASTQASSTRSSNGNPFQWDPAPLSSGKPSALKGSPSARKGHRRKNCVRISLDPTILGPPSRPPSPLIMKDIQEESPNTTSEKRTSIGLGFSTTRSLPKPPSTSTFAPDLKHASMPTQAALSPSSPSPSLPSYDHGPVGSPVMRYHASGYPPMSNDEGNRLSNGSMFSIPTFPSPCHGIGLVHSTAPVPPMFALTRPSSEHDDYRDDSPVIPSSPFQVHFPSLPSSPERPLLADEYDPERPHLVFQTPNSSPAPRNGSSGYVEIPEGSSVNSKRTVILTPEQPKEDSPPCSPRTERPNPFLASEQSFHQYVDSQPSIPGGYMDTIDPAVLSKDASSVSNSNFNDASTSILNPEPISRNSKPMPTSPGSARSMFEPLLEASFPSSPPIHQFEDCPHTPNNACSRVQSNLELPTISIQSSPSSMYSSPSPGGSPSPSRTSPRSPRPRHAQLPTPALNFTEMPMLSPSLGGPRGSPPRPLRSSIQKLRRMNSDAEKKGSERDGRGERRYLRLGRGHSIALPGDESWLDELETTEIEEEESTMNEEKQRHLVGDLLDDWEEEATMLQVEDESKSNTVTDAIAGAEDPNCEDDQKKSEEDKELLFSAPSSPKTLPTDRSSSIWEDGDKFWTSTPPPKNPPNSPNKPKNNFIPLSSSPLSTPVLPSKSRKRDFEVAKDDSPANEAENTIHEAVEAEFERKIAGSRRRKRSALGVGTPNVRIQVQPPSSDGFVGTPGSLYDAAGFLRV